MWCGPVQSKSKDQTERRNIGSYRSGWLATARAAKYNQKKEHLQFFFFLESALFSVDSYVLLSIGINNLVAGDSQDQPYQIRCSRSRGPDEAKCTYAHPLSGIVWDSGHETRERGTGPPTHQNLWTVDPVSWEVHVFLKDMFPCVFDSLDRVRVPLNFGGYDFVISEPRVDGP